MNGNDFGYISLAKEVLVHSEIERVQALSRKEFVEKFLNRNEPVIITDVASRWRAFTEWTPEYFKSVAGDATITVHYEENASFFDWYVYDAKRVNVKFKFGELVDLLLNDPSAQKYYMTEHKLRLVSPDLLRDVDFGDYFDLESQPYEPMLFLGRETCMPLHYHGKMEAFLCQLYGEKTVTLYSPEQYPFLYAGKWHEPHPLFSRIDGRKIFAGQVDLKRFPKFKHVNPIQFTLRPGEMLFIPVHWWHLTRVAGYQVSVSHFFKSKLRCWRFPTPGVQVIAREILLRTKKGNKARLIDNEKGFIVNGRDTKNDVQV